MSGNAHVRCEVGENPEIISKDYLSLLPKIESAEMMFSAARSRRLQIVPVIQSFAQLERNYGKESADIIIDNVQLFFISRNSIKITRKPHRPDRFCQPRKE